MKEKVVIVLLLVVVLLVSGCGIIEENKSLKTKNKELEQRVEELEQKVKDLEQTNLKLQQDNFSLNTCLEWAKQRRDRNLKLNDTEHKKGSYVVSTQVFEQIQKLYRDDCEECYRKYGRR